MTKLHITVVIPVKNDATNLGQCLERLSRFSSVVVIDSSSTDGTPDVGRSYGAEVLNFQWDGHYPKKRNWFLFNHEPSTPWVMFLDADEFVNDEFCDELESAINDSTINGFWLNYTNYFLGRRLKFGDPQRKLALFRTGSALYERIEENSWSELDMEIHEHPIVDGAVGEIKIPIEHNNDRALPEFLQRHLSYAKWEAQRYRNLQNNLADCEHLTRRQKFKYRNINKWWFSIAYFIYAYIYKLGFLDARAGLYYAFYKARYFLSIRRIIQNVS